MKKLIVLLYSSCLFSVINLRAMENQLNAEHVQTMLENIGFPAANAPQEEKDLFHALFVFELKNRQMALNTKKARIAEITQRVRTALAPTLHGIATVLGQQ